MIIDLLKKKKSFEIFFFFSSMFNREIIIICRKFITRFPSNNLSSFSIIKGNDYQLLVMIVDDTHDKSEII